MWSFHLIPTQQKNSIKDIWSKLENGKLSNEQYNNIVSIYKKYQVMPNMCGACGNIREQVYLWTKYGIANKKFD